MMLSLRMYRATLLLYPADFRCEYGDDMVAAFAADLASTGRVAAWRCCLPELFHIALPAQREHRCNFRRGRISLFVSHSLRDLPLMLPRGANPCRLEEEEEEGALGTEAVAEEEAEEAEYPAGQDHQSEPCRRLAHVAASV